MRGPAYYCPPGVDRPAHIRSPAPMRLEPGAGPDGLGGTCYGRGFYPHERDQWKLDASGWWANLVEVSPRELLRADALPGIIVAGWTVPVLLAGEASKHGWWDRDGYHVPDELVGLVALLQGLLDYTGPVSIEHAALAASILQRNHHATWCEFTALGPLTSPLAWMVIQGASGSLRG